MAEIVEKIIDPGNGPGTDYTSLQDWVWARAGDLVSRDTIEIARCRCTNGQADTNVAIADQFITDADHYVKIYTEPSEGFRHQGIYPAPGSNIYRIEGGSTSGIIIDTAHVYIEGIAIKMGEISYAGAITLQNISHRGEVNNCLLSAQLSTASSLHGLYLQNATANGYIYLKNNIIEGFAKNNPQSWDECSGINCYAQSGTITLWMDNNTIVNCNSGVKGSGVIHARNNIIQDCTTQCFGGSTYQGDSTNNISDDATAPAFGSYWRNTNVDFLDAPNKNYHLSPTDTAAPGNGIDLTNDPDHPFNDDIDGQLRGDTWDVGADQITISIVISPVVGEVSSQSNLQASPVGKLNASGAVNVFSVITDLLLNAKAKAQSVLNASAVFTTLLLTAFGSLSCNTGATSNLSGLISASGTLTPHAVEVQTGLTGTIQSRLPVSGEINSQSFLTSGITFWAGAVSGLTEVSSNLSAGIRAIGNIDGAIPALTAQSSQLTANGNGEANISSEAILTATLQANAPVEGSVNAQLNLSAYLSSPVYISGSINSHFTLTTYLIETAEGRINGDVESLSLITADLKAAGNIEGIISVLTAHSSLLKAKGNIEGIISSLSAQSSSLKAKGNIEGVIPALIAQSSSLKAKGEITGGINLTLHLTGDLAYAIVPIEGIISALTAQSSLLKAKGNVEGIISSLTAQSSLLKATATNQGIIEVNSLLSGNLFAGAISGVITIDSSSLAELKAKGNIEGIIHALIAQNTLLKADGKLNGSLHSEASFYIQRQSPVILVLDSIISTDIILTSKLI